MLVQGGWRKKQENRRWGWLGMSVCKHQRLSSRREPMQCIPPKKQSATFPIRFTAAVFLSALIFGCAQNARYYFYKGNPRPSNVVATMVFG
jgi:hypothetical protein